MRHRRKKIHLGRTLGHRRALLKNLATSLILYEKIETTLAKAKTLRPEVERLIAGARRGSLSARRLAAAQLTHKKAVRKLFEVLGPKYQNRPGGYTRVRRLRKRAGDAAEVAVISLVD